MQDHGCLFSAKIGKQHNSSYSHKNTLPSIKWGCNYLAQPNRFQACGNSLLSAVSSGCLLSRGLHVWVCYYLVENLPIDLMRTARIEVRRKTTSTTGQSIRVVSARAFWRSSKTLAQALLAVFASARQRQHDCAGGTSHFSQFQHLKCF